MRRAVVPAVVVLLVGLVGAGHAVALSRTGIVDERIVLNILSSVSGTDNLVLV